MKGLRSFQAAFHSKYMATRRTRAYWTGLAAAFTTERHPGKFQHEFKSAFKPRRPGFIANETLVTFGLQNPEPEAGP